MKKFELLQEKLRLEKPIIQGGMAVSISTAELAAAVSEAGGFGVIGASGMSPDELREEIKKTRLLTSRPFGVNIMAAVTAFLDLLRVALEEKVAAVFVGAGFVRDFIKMCRDAGVLPIPVVSSVKAALLAERLGAEAVVLESGEAGGHLGTFEKTFELLPEVVASVKIPVIAAGGLITKEDIKKAFDFGAAAVQLGTAFAASRESAAHEDYKKFYVEARTEDIVIIDSPAGLPGRALKNRFVSEIVIPGKRHLPKIIKSCIKCLKICKHNFCILDALVCAQKGYIDDGLVFCGSRVGEVKKVLAAGEIIASLGF